jgi:KaiC/GvpD/RAD55 family RecA-like ATPase
MKRPGRSRPGPEGEPLPVVFQKLGSAGIHIRRAQVTLLVAEPNGFKTGLAMFWATRLAQKGQKVLYLSADTDEHVMECRMVCMLTGQRFADVEKARMADARGDSMEWNYYSEPLLDLKTFFVDYNTDPDYNYLYELMLAQNELWGTYPDLVVMDNLGNFVPGREDEWLALHESIKVFKAYARESGSAFLVPHHANETTDGESLKAPKRKNITGKVAKYPDAAIGIALDDEQGVLHVSPLKSRTSRKDVSGSHSVDLWVDADRMAIYDTQWNMREKAGQI